MLIFNDEQRLRAGIKSLSKRCPYCSKALAAYPLILSDDAGLFVYHAACAAALATEILVDLYTCFRPPAPYQQLFVLDPRHSANAHERREPMQSTDLAEIKAAIFEQASHPCTRVRWGASPGDGGQKEQGATA